MSHGQTHDMKNWLIVAPNVAYAGTSKSSQLTVGTENGRQYSFVPQFAILSQCVVWRCNSSTILKTIHYLKCQVLKQASAFCTHFHNALDTCTHALFIMKSGGTEANLSRICCFSSCHVLGFDWQSVILAQSQRKRSHREQSRLSEGIHRSGKWLSSHARTGNAKHDGVAYCMKYSSSYLFH